MQIESASLPVYISGVHTVRERMSNREMLLACHPSISTRLSLLFYAFPDLSTHANSYSAFRGCNYRHTLLDKLFIQPKGGVMQIIVHTMIIKTKPLEISSFYFYIE